MAIKILLLVAITAFAAVVNGRALPADKNAAELHTEFYHFHFPRYGGRFGGGARTGYGGVAGRPRIGGFIGSGGGGGSSFDGGAGTGANGSLESGGGSGGAGGDGVEGGLEP